MLLSQFAKVFEKSSYLRYWLAYTLSAIGFELILFVLMVVLFDRTKTALSMGTFTGIFMFCLVAFGPVAGICTDRWKRKNIFLVCNALLGILILVTKYLQEAFWIYFLWFLASLLFAFLRPARVALITNLFPKEDYFKANSAFTISLNLSKIGGPLIGGLLLISLSMEWVVNAIVSFFGLSLISVSTVPFGSSSLGPSDQKRPSWNWRDSTTGIFFLLADRGLRFYVLLGMLRLLFLASQLPLFIVYIKTFLGGSTEDYSLFMTTLAIGGAVGSFIAGGIENFLSRKTMIYGGLGASYLSFALLPLCPTLLFALIMMGVSNLSLFIAHVAIHSDIQRMTPDEIRGKVFASSPILLIPIGLISVFIATPLADRIGVEWIFLFSGLLALSTLPLPGYLSKSLERVFQPSSRIGADLSKSINP
jgi:NRE family putative nickel resistance protein-like MFS transporter